MSDFAFNEMMYNVDFLSYPEKITLLQKLADSLKNVKNVFAADEGSDSEESEAYISFCEKLSHAQSQIDEGNVIDSDEALKQLDIEKFQ